MYRHRPHLPHNQNTQSFFDDLKHTKLSGALTALYSNRIIQQIAGGLIGLFFPVLLYLKFNQSLYKVLIYFLLSFGIWFFIVPVGARIMSRIGLKKSLIFSVMVGWAWYFFVRQFEMDGALIFLLFALVAVNLDRMLYWIPYHTDFAEFTDKKNRAKQMFFLIAIASIVSVFVPFVSGQLVSNYGYDILFLFALMIYLTSIIPIFLIPDVRENYSYGYFQTFRELFKRKNRKMLLSYSADGMQSFIGTSIWPIFLFLILDGNYAIVGAISSVIILVSLILQVIMGDISDRFDKRKILMLGTVLNSIGWFVKMFVATGFEIFIASTYHNFANVVMRTPLDALMYEKAADSGHYIDEYTVLREMALTIGRILTIGLIALVFCLTGSIPAVFLVAAVSALIINFL